MTKQNKKKAIAACDEGMILSQTLMDRAETYEELKLAKHLFTTFYGCKMAYKELKPEE